MTDIVERLRAWVYTDSQYATAREAADEIERLRALCDRWGELAVERRRKIERLCQDLAQKNITDEERLAINEASDFYVGTRTGATLVGLLKRI